MSSKTEKAPLLQKKKDNFYTLLYNPGFGPLFPEQDTLFLFKEAMESNEPDYAHIYEEIQPGDQILVELDLEHEFVKQILATGAESFVNYVPTVYVFNTAKSPDPEINLKAARRCV